MLMLAAVLMLIAMSHLQEDEPAEPPPTSATRHRKEAGRQSKRWGKHVYCVYMCSIACICMLAAVLMLTVMQTRLRRAPAPAQDAASNSNDDSKEDNEVSIPVCGGMHLDA